MPRVPRQTDSNAPNAKTHCSGLVHVYDDAPRPWVPYVWERTSATTSTAALKRCAAKPAIVAVSARAAKKPCALCLLCRQLFEFGTSPVAASNVSPGTGRAQCVNTAQAQLSVERRRK